MEVMEKTRVKMDSQTRMKMTTIMKIILYKTDENKIKLININRP